MTLAMTPIAPTRRSVLAAGGALIVSVMLDAKIARAADMKPVLAPTALASWIAIRQNGDVMAYFGKVDVGLGVHVAIAQIVAEELDVQPARITVVMGDTDLTVNQGGASGSTGVESGGVALRNAAAQARLTLLQLAAQKFSVPLESLDARDGMVFITGDAARNVSYGDLIGGRHFDVTLDWNGQLGNGLVVKGPAALKRHDQYRVVGQSLPRADIADKILARETYVTDMRVPGMAHGRMVRPPVAGAMPVSVDAASVAAIPNVRVVHRQGVVGVVADTEWNAIRAARQLKITWSAVPPAFPDQAGLYETMKAAKADGGAPDKSSAAAKAALAGAAHVVTAEYRWPFQSHASMGPACAIADIRADGATVWTGDQKPHYVREGVAALTGLPLDSVHAIWMRGPGSYGRNDGGDAALDAALLSQAVGRPVRLQGMRADGTAWNPKGPASVHTVTAGLDADNKVVAFHYVSKAFSRENIASHPDDPAQSLSGQLLGMTPAPKQVFDNPEEGYAFANTALEWETVPPLLERASPLRTSHLRDPLGPQLNFASESFIDELAHAAGVDPVAFRLAHLKDARGAAVIQAAATRANWQPRTERIGGSRAGNGGLMIGRGIAFAKRRNTRVAVIAEIELDPATGRVWPRRWVVAHDCGLIVNPGTLNRVIEGNILHATSRALFEEVMFSRTAVTSVDWASYPILEMRDAPEAIDIVLLDHPDEMPRGAGEPSTRPVAAAIANAIFDASGVRLRQAPFTRARVKAALAVSAG